MFFIIYVFKLVISLTGVTVIQTVVFYKFNFCITILIYFNKF